MSNVIKQNILAIIPARGGSKRVPKKNIKLFCGKPLISYPLQMLKKSNFVDDVIVSTDSEDIKFQAEAFGANVPFIRPANLSDDHATTFDAVSHAATWYINNCKKIDFILTIYPSAVSITHSHILSAYNSIQDHDLDCAFSAIEYSHPIQRAFHKNDKGFAEMINKENYSVRTQDFKRTFHDAGQFYLTKTRSFFEEKTTIPRKSSPIFLNKSSCVDIDSEDDFLFAEKIYKINNDK
jgi:pseudaminic acid cytidylyltransferase